MSIKPFLFITAIVFCVVAISAENLKVPFQDFATPKPAISKKIYYLTESCSICEKFRPDFTRVKKPEEPKSEEPMSTTNETTTTTVETGEKLKRVTRQASIPNATNKKDVIMLDYEKKSGNDSDTKQDGSWSWKSAFKKIHAKWIETYQNNSAKKVDQDITAKLKLEKDDKGDEKKKIIIEFKKKIQNLTSLNLKNDTLSPSSLSNQSTEQEEMEKVLVKRDLKQVILDPVEQPSIVIRAKRSTAASDVNDSLVETKTDSSMLEMTTLPKQIFDENDTLLHDASVDDNDKNINKNGTYEKCRLLIRIKSNTTALEDDEEEDDVEMSEDKKTNPVEHDKISEDKKTNPEKKEKMNEDKKANPEEKEKMNEDKKINPEEKEKMNEDNKTTSMENENKNEDNKTIPVEKDEMNNNNMAVVSNETTTSSPVPSVDQAVVVTSTPSSNSSDVVETTKNEKSEKKQKKNKMSDMELGLLINIRKFVGGIYDTLEADANNSITKQKEAMKKNPFWSNVKIFTSDPAMTELFYEGEKMDKNSEKEKDNEKGKRTKRSIKTNSFVDMIDMDDIVKLLSPNGSIDLNIGDEKWILLERKIFFNDYDDDSDEELIINLFFKPKEQNGLEQQQQRPQQQEQMKHKLSCPLATFDCNSDGHLCIPNSLICNGEDNCGNGRDEMVPNCATSFNMFYVHDSSLLNHRHGDDSAWFDLDPATEEMFWLGTRILFILFATSLFLYILLLLCRMCDRIRYSDRTPMFIIPKGNYISISGDTIERKPYQACQRSTKSRMDNQGSRIREYIYVNNNYGQPQGSTMVSTDVVGHKRSNNFPNSSPDMTDDEYPPLYEDSIRNYGTKK